MAGGYRRSVEEVLIMSLSTAEELLLAACRGEVRTGSTDDWALVLDLAQRHQVTALLHTALAKVQAQSAIATTSQSGQAMSSHLSDDSTSGMQSQELTALWDVVEQQYALMLIQHGLACQELIKILTALDGIPTLVVKGPALAAYLYPDSCRLYSDIDIVIHDRDYTKARDALLIMGYHIMPPYSEHFQRTIGTELGLIRHDEDGVPWAVELHWRLAQPTGTALDEEGIWARARQITIDGYPVYTPGPEDTLILLVLNLRKYRFTRLKALCDLDRLLRLEAERIDWSVVHQQAHAADACVVLRHALDLAHQLLGSPIPTSQLPWCTRQLSLHGWILRRLVREDVLLHDGRQTAEQELVDALLGLMPFVTLDRMRTVARLVLRRLMLSPEYASYRIGAQERYRSRLDYLATVVSQVARASRAARQLFS
jgi:hypothetical protein